MPASDRPTYRARRKPEERPRTRRARRSRRPDRRFPAVVVAILVVLSVSALGTWWSLSSGNHAVEHAANAATQPPAVTATETKTVETKSEQAPATHVTFGSHTTATQSCVSCHPDNPKPGTIACRDCHKNVCGKDAETVADCLECHQTGTTEEWSP